MHTVEKFIEGKYKDPLTCEDRLVLTEELTAVIDGATAKGKMLWEGQKSGKFAATVLGDYIESHSESLAGSSAVKCFETLTKVLRTRVRELCGEAPLDIKDYPRASVVIFNGQKNEVWSYGDCQYMIGGALHTCDKEVDRLAASLRSFILERELLTGAAPENLADHDVGRDAIRGILETQFYFENKPVRFGYPVINGLNFDPSMVVACPVKPGEEVVLASDGYPELCPTLAESEQHLAGLLEEDPLCFRENPGTKGLMPGMVSFDDRTYWRGTAEQI